ncbi:hypothetical protein [Cupriavidus basilensis]
MSTSRGQLRTRRLAEVVAALYRQPGDGIRQAFTLSRDDAVRLPRLASVAIVSITVPGRQPASLDGFEHVLRLSFADVDFLSSTLSPEAQASLNHAFTAEQARAIRSFTDALPPKVASVVIHCEGGYSRSCAIALALHQLYDYRTELGRLEQANPSVHRVMMTDAQERAGSRDARRPRGHQ